MKKFMNLSLAVFMAVLMAVLSPIQTLAASTNQYLSDIKIAYGADGDKLLTEAGYQVFETLDANNGGNGGPVWIGYKTTTNSNEAITDISLMNMKGGYSFEAYQQELEEISNNITAMLNNFSASIKEFRENYKNKSEYAIRAYTLLQKIVEDDTGSKMGDLMLDAGTDEATLHTIFMQGNTEILDVIYTALALGCTDVSDDSFLDRLENTVLSDEIPPSRNNARTQIAGVLDDFRAQLLNAKSTADAIKDAGGIDAYCQTIEESEVDTALYYQSLYEAATTYKFGNTGLTLYDAMMLPTTYTGNNQLYLDDTMIDLLATAVTPGQVGAVGTVGLGSLVANAYSTKAKANENAAMKESFSYVDTCLKELDDIDDISVYFGVDRSLFTDTDSIALTSAAIREKAKTEGADFGKSKDWRENKALRISLAVLSGVTGAVAIGCGAAAIAMKATLNITYNTTFTVVGYSAAIDGLQFASKKALTEAMMGHLPDIYQDTSWKIMNFQTSTSTCCFGTYSAIAFKALAVVGAVAMVASLVLTFLTVQSYLYHPDTEKVEYTKIPRVLVDMKYDEKAQKTYYVYYAAKLVTAAENETDSLKLYGDLNALNGSEEWVALYYSKDARLGNPLTPTALVKGNTKLTSTQAKNYKAVHDFNSTAAANFNQFSKKSGAPSIYFFLKMDTSAANNTGSIFASSTLSIGIIAFTVGAALAFILTITEMKRRNKKGTVESN